MTALAAYNAPDHLDHVIVASGNVVQEWYYTPGPPQPPVRPPVVDFTVSPNDGRRDHAYFNVGGSATLHWDVGNCQHCVVSMRGFGGFGYGTPILNSAKLPMQGTLSVTPGASAERINTKYVLTAIGDTGTTTKEVYIDQYVPPGTNPAGQVFCFKLTNPQSFAMPCLTYCVVAKDGDTAKRAVAAAYADYKVETIAEGSVTTACQ
jgi:hypothetical protein